MRKLIVFSIPRLLILVGLLLVSCDIGGESRDAVCRHKAVMAALIYSEYYPVRIAYGPNKEEYHCQAQAYIDGRWHFLRVIPLQIQVDTDEQDEFEITAYYSLESFFDQFWYSRGWGNSLE